MIREYLSQIFSSYNFLLLKSNLIGLSTLYILMQILLIVLKKMVSKKRDHRVATVIKSSFWASSLSLFLIMLSVFLVLLQKNIVGDDLLTLYYLGLSYGIGFLGVSGGLLFFFNGIYRAYNSVDAQSEKLDIIVNLSKRSLNGSVLVGGFVLYIRQILTLLPGTLRLNLWVVGFIFFFSLILILALYVAIKRIFPLLINYIVRKESSSQFYLNLLKALNFPLRIGLIPLFLLMTKDLIGSESGLFVLLNLLLKLSASTAFLLFLYQFIDLILLGISKISEKDDNQLDKTLIEMLRMISSIIFVCLTLFVFVRIFTGKSLTTLLAGLGIGGLAVALAAQDTLKNFFGSLMLMTDKPFKIGERVLTEGYDGIIESIGFRSTRIRTLTGHQVIIPNEKVAQSPIENIAKRPSIRRLTNITLTYNTSPEKVKRAIEIISNILEDHEGMDSEFPPRVYFNEFNSDSLNILMIYWYFPPNYWDFLAFSQRVNLQIMSEFAAESIDFAFPTLTTYLEQGEGTSLKFSFDKDLPIKE